MVLFTQPLPLLESTKTQNCYFKELFLKKIVHVEGSHAVFTASLVVCPPASAACGKTQLLVSWHGLNCQFESKFPNR